MKFIYCSNCKDIVVPKSIKRKCTCKASYCYIFQDITHYGGDFAVAMNFKDEWFSKDSKGVDVTAIHVTKNVIVQVTDADRYFCTKVIEYLNALTGSAFSTKFPSSASDFILSRKKEHLCSMEDFERIINKKWREWYGTSQQKYMRPETLFNKKKFFTYLGEKDHGEQQADSNSQFSKFAKAVSGAASKADSTGGSQKS